MKVGSLVVVRPPLVNGTRRVWTGRVTAVGAGTTLTCVVKKHGSVGGTSFTIPRWDRAAGATTGWERD
jgi:hypothetical protein